MAIPDKPLRLTVNNDDLDLDEQALFYEPEAPYRPTVFKAFLKKYGNWTAKEIAGLQLRDVRELFAECRRQLQEAQVPKGSG